MSIFVSPILCRPKVILLRRQLKTIITRSHSFVAFFFRLRALISWILIWATNYPRPPGTQPTIIQIPKQISKSLLKIFHLTEEISKSNYRECTMLQSQRLASFWILRNGHFVWNERRPDWTFFRVSPFSCLSLLMSARWIFFVEMVLDNRTRKLGVAIVTKLLWNHLYVLFPFFVFLHINWLQIPQVPSTRNSKLIYMPLRIWPSHRFGSCQLVSDKDTYWLPWDRLKKKG